MDGGFGEGALSLLITALRVHTMGADMIKGERGGLVQRRMMMYVM